MSKQSVWIDAAVTLVKDPRHLVRCPECDRGFLSFADTRMENGARERHLRCKVCGAQSSVLLSFDTPAEDPDKASGVESPDSNIGCV